MDTPTLLASFSGMYAALHEGQHAAGILSDLTFARSKALSSEPVQAEAARAEHAEAHRRLHQLRLAKDYAYEQLKYLQQVQQGLHAPAPDSLIYRLGRLSEALALSKVVVDQQPSVDEAAARARHAFVFQHMDPALPYRGQAERLRTVVVGIQLQVETQAYLARVQANPEGPHWTVADVERRARELHRSINHVRLQSDEPYEVHLEEAVELIKSVPHTRRMVAGGWLHDVIDDIPGVTRELVAAETDETVAELVEALSDHEKGLGNRQQRKAAERQRIAGADWETQTVRVADIISNVRTIVQRNPEFARVYVPEKAALLDVLTKADPTLLARARQVVQDAQDQLRGLFGGTHG